jgi:hypothetical protein
MTIEMTRSKEEKALMMKLFGGSSLWCGPSSSCCVGVKSVPKSKEQCKGNV